MQGRNNGNIAIALESLSDDATQYLALKSDVAVCYDNAYQYSSAHFITPCMDGYRPFVSVFVSLYWRITMKASICTIVSYRH